MIKNVTPALWVYPKGKDNPAVHLLSHSAGLDTTFIIVEYRMRALHNNYVVYVKEIFSTTFFTQDPAATLYEVVRVYSQCGAPTYPIELVYIFGGTLNHEQIRIKINQVLH